MNKIIKNSDKVIKILEENIELKIKHKLNYKEPIGVVYMRVKYIAICPKCGNMEEWDDIEPMKLNIVYCSRCNENFPVRKDWEQADLI